MQDITLCFQDTANVLMATKFPPDMFDVCPLKAGNIFHLTRWVKVEQDTKTQGGVQV
jgi:hypothetical protein